ncbi:hypothetical protein ACROYT_G006874 [Oculina patagonica]
MENMTESDQLKETNYRPETIVIINCIFNAPLMLISIIGNSLVLAAILKTPTLNSPSIMFLCSLAVSDLFVGFIVQPLYIAYELTKFSSLYELMIAMSVNGVGVSLGTVTVISTFCDSDSECHSTDAEELSCREQPDISRFNRVCMAKLGEGATCGHSSLFDLFRRAEDVSNYCKKGLVCRTVGFFGRRACIRGYEDNSEEAKSDDEDDEASKKEIKSSKDKKEDKSKKLKF